MAVRSIAMTLVVWTNLAADGRDPATTIARSLPGQIHAKAPLTARPQGMICGK